MFKNGIWRFVQISLVFFMPYSSIIAASVNSRDIQDEIILATDKIQKGCSAHKAYDTGWNYISLVSILKWCQKADELPLDSTSRKVCRFIEITDIEKMKILCAREQVGKKYSPKQLIPYEQAYHKANPCEADGSICYERFLIDFSRQNLPKFKQCLDDKKFYYQNLCNLFAKKETVISYH